MVRLRVMFFFAALLWGDSLLACARDVAKFAQDMTGRSALSWDTVFDLGRRHPENAEARSVELLRLPDPPAKDVANLMEKAMKVWTFVTTEEQKAVLSQKEIGYYGTAILILYLQSKSWQKLREALHLDSVAAIDLNTVFLTEVHLDRWLEKAIQLSREQRFSEREFLANQDDLNNLWGRLREMTEAELPLVATLPADLPYRPQEMNNRGKVSRKRTVGAKKTAVHLEFVAHLAGDPKNPNHDLGVKQLVNIVNVLRNVKKKGVAVSIPRPVTEGMLKVIQNEGAADTATKTFFKRVLSEFSTGANRSDPLAIREIQEWSDIPASPPPDKPPFPGTP